MQLLRCATFGVQSPEPRAQSTDVDAWVVATGDLVGMALRSIAPEDVTVPQFRVLLVLHEQGRISSSQVARMLGLAPSSVTRVADRLGATELIERGSMPEHRGVVALSLQPAGTRLVLRALQRRRNEFAQVLDRLEPDARRAAAEALREIHALLGDNQTIGPVH